MSTWAQGLRACVRKELLLLSRDLHGLALLFLMPLAFVLIMSLALQDRFAGPQATKLKVLVLDADNSDASQGVLALLTNGKAFELVTPEASLDDAAVDEHLRRKQYAFAVRIAAGFSDALTSSEDERSGALIQISVAPDTGKQTETIFVTTVTAALGRERMRAILDGLGMSGAVQENTSTDIAVRYAYTGGSNTRRPSSVQQSVPAWLVFGAFFVVMPLSSTLIKERQQGTLRRLRSTNLGTLTLMLGKLLPYFAINQIQLLLMLGAGCFLVPLLGGDALQLTGSMVLLATMSVTLSICALGLALLIAVSAGTTEQAALLGGTGNILLAALGGIMVPKFVMPETLQYIAQWSPMSWGLEGFLDVLLRDGSLRDIAPEALGLTLLGMAAILLAWRIQSRRAD